MGRLVLAFSFLGFFALASPARAQVERGVSLQAVAAAGAGFTDNVASVPDNPPGGLRGPESDSFADIQPSLVLAYGGNRTTQRLAYTFFANFYATHSEANSYSNSLTYQSSYETSARTRLSLDSSVAAGKFSTFHLASDQATVSQLPAGGFGYVSVRVGQGLSYEPTPEWHYSEGAGYLTFLPVDAGMQPSSSAVDLDLGVERSWKANAIGFGVHSSLLLLGDLPGQMSTTSRTQLLESASVRWRHDLNLQWSMELGAGATTVFQANDLSQNATEPSGHAALRYTQADVTGELAFSHHAQPNLFVAQTFFVDEVTLHAGLPLGRSGFSVGAGTGYQYSRAVGIGAKGSANVFLADGALTWAPLGSSWGAALRYYHFQQTSEEVMGAMGLPSLSRNVVLLNVSAAYPNQQAGGKPLKSPLRVDKTDVAAEP